ncbi:5,6-dimethylbenzimidazole synthase [Paenochrobactrum pullorum]|uniref:5,6-dimethylbenzimidazole synthase n=1 Tax=Paenochrobactrum pullorum TaxID=1324351 RepID=UPI0035BBBA1B
MNFAASDQQTLLNIMRWRRDVRHFKTEAVPDHLLKELQHAIQLSPSVGNSRPWRIFAVKSQQIRAQIYDNFQQANAEAATIYDERRSIQYAQLKLEAIQTAPIQLAVFTETNPDQGHGLGRQTIKDTLIQSTAMAIQNLNLVARSLGLGVGMVSILNPHAIEQLFKVPESWQFSFYLCIGWPAFDSDQPLLHQLGWQENDDENWIEI